MATAAFKSTTKRNPLNNSPSESSTRNSGHHRRSRSLSGFSHSTPEPRGKFVNTVRGTGFPEISLDDLACEFFGSDESDGRGGRSVKRGSDGGDGKLRRGRSVSRCHSGGSGNVGSNVGGATVGSGCKSRRRSISVARRYVGDFESDTDCTQSSRICTNSKKIHGDQNSHGSSIFSFAAAQVPQQGLRKSFSQKDFIISDDHSSQSSGLTDEEGKDAAAIKKGNEKPTRAFNAQRKSGRHDGDVNDGRLYEAMREELRHVVKEMKEEIENAMLKTGVSTRASTHDLQLNTSDMLQTVSSAKRNSTSKMEQSTNYKQDLLEIMLEGQGREKSDVITSLLSGSVNNVLDMSPAFRKRSNERFKTSKKLTEEAEKYIEDFISNVEDTDISSLDGEISDTSSILGGMLKLESFQSPTTTTSLPAEMDGISLPWLQWETSNDASLSYKRKPQLPITPKALTCSAAQGSTTLQDISNYSSSSHGSWSPATVDVTLSSNGEDIQSRSKDVRTCGTLRSSRMGHIDVGQYLKLESSEDLIFERWKQQERVTSGCLLLCDHMF